MIDQRLATLTRIGSLLNSQGSLDVLLDMIVEASIDLMAAEACSLFLIDEEKKELFFHCVRGQNPEKLKNLRVPLGLGIVGTVALTGEPLLIVDAQNDPRWYKGVDEETSFVTRTILCVPLKTDKKILGALEVINKTNRASFNEEELDLFQALAGFAAVAIENANLKLDLELLFRDSLLALVNLIEASDSYTRGHSERVTAYSGLIAGEMDLEPQLLTLIETAGMLHDIGKIGIDNDIIRKPSKLNDEEFLAIQRHPTIGFNAVKDIHQLSRVLPGILHHHERFDGRGYPQKLVGVEIPLIARIIAIADTYDAMTSTRPYRPALEREVAVMEIERCAGSQFDPMIVPFFLQAIRKNPSLF